VIHTRFSVKFFLTALLFMLFDLEVVILIPWTFIYREFLANQIAILGPILFFIGVLVLGLVYEVKKGALQWEK
jgi:NADH-quinone oxidoreductase subunit A